MNGQANINAIKVAEESGVRRLVLLGAKIPCFLRTSRFAYFQGKRMAKRQARSFAKIEPRSAVVFEPGVVVGRRFLKNGNAIALDLFLAPFLKLMPSQFIDINRLAKRVAKEAINIPAKSTFDILENKDL